MTLAIIRRYSNDVVGYIRPSSLSVSLKADGASTATMKVVEGDNIALGDWVRIETPNRESAVYYVKSINRNYVTGELNVNLEHGINLLNDAVAFGEIKTPVLAGRSGAATVDMRTAIVKLMTYQNTVVWQAGTIECTEAQGWAFTNSTVLAAINGMMDSVNGYAVTYDQSVFPWRLNVTAYPSIVTMEMRRNRNMSSMKTTVDRNGMFTRVYPVGKGNKGIESVNNGVKYIDKNVDLYGVVEHVLTDGSISDANRLKRYGEAQLDLFAHPLVTVSIDGFDLSEATGEPLDRLSIGKLCRVPLPELGETFVERITELTYKDVIQTPDVVSVTLATVRKTVQGVINQKSGGGSKATTAANCELGEHAQTISEITGSVLWTQKENIIAAVGELIVTTEGGTRTLTVKDGTKLEVSQNGVKSEVISAGNVLSAINQSAESVTINASKINLSGYVTASQLSATQADIDNLKAGVTTASMIKTVSIFATNSLFVGSTTYNATWQSARLADGTYIYYLGHE